ncbi:hypothetical protein [Clostridium beijerinckii]|uniref:hypothetical protein n=1 Tax=Clostridium beijerinckii TaxID=1520 RepID=UPI0012DB5425|nr:hypothetical protein [Clostridium beijerinckii]NRT39460.1 hypothetical protein [Clostridium beijerinckii]
MDIYIVNNKPMISDEILNGVYEHFDRDTDELVGISIENYKNRNECELYNVLPFKLDFDYIENNIIKNFKN